MSLHQHQQSFGGGVLGKTSLVWILRAGVVTLLLVFGVLNVWLHHKATSISSLHHQHSSLFSRQHHKQHRHRPRRYQHDGDDGLMFVRNETYGRAFYPRAATFDHLDKILDDNYNKKDGNNNDASSVHRFAMMTWQSNQHMFNQDRGALIQPFMSEQTKHDNQSFLVMILDGHGELGHVMAEYAREELPQRLSLNLSRKPCCQADSWIQQQLNHTFWQVNQDAPPPGALRGGCTASVTLRIGSKLFFANAGDSRTILVRYNNNNQKGDDASSTAPTEILHMTRLDKAHLPDERARIERMGGRIHTPKDAPKQSRVVLYSVSAIPHEPIGLAMSRSLGDWEWKEDGVTAEPIVNVIDLNSSLVVVTDGGTEEKEESRKPVLFLIAASDGIWDCRKPQFYANQFAQALVATTTTTATTRELFGRVHDIVRQAAPQNLQWYRDDMTAIVVNMVGA